MSRECAFLSTHAETQSSTSGAKSGHGEGANETEERRREAHVGNPYIVVKTFFRFFLPSVPSIHFVQYIWNPCNAHETPISP